MTVRALFTAAKVEGISAPFDTIHLKVYYPAQASGSDTERMTGMMAADESLAPFPVIVFFNGINVGPEGYQWLAEYLAERGSAVVLFSWVSETLPGVYGLTPGIDLTKVRPDTYGSSPTANGLSAILSALEKLNVGPKGEHIDSPLEGRLDFKKIVLGGHSAGGTVALQNANPKWFPQVLAGFAYAGHTMASTMLGWGPGTILPISSEVPMLIMGGTRDGVIAASAGRYGATAEPDPTGALRRTFAEGLTGTRGDRYLILLEGANHFSIAHPIDQTAGRTFLDRSPTQPEDEVRSLVAALTANFINVHVRGVGEMNFNNRLILVADRK